VIFFSASVAVLLLRSVPSLAADPVVPPAPNAAEAPLDQSAIAEEAKPPASPARALKATNYNPLYGSVVPPGQPYQPLTGKQRWQLFLIGSLGNPGIPFRSLVPAAFDLKNRDPEGWGQGMKGYAQRAGNRFGRFTIQDGLEGLSSHLVGYETRYIFSTSKNPWRRAGHALAMNFVTYNRHGKWVPHYPRVGMTFASEYLANLWMPKGAQTNAEATRGIMMQLGAASLFNLVKEFSPEMKRAFKRRK
jgi:hypothetical protein